jgi:DNA-binding winged helix-turn-helix (wHTH) protein/tetratricopeptide (TPR) repeat protein
MPALAMRAVLFGPYRLDLESGELSRSGVAVKLQPQPAKLLSLLVEHAGELVTREDIRRRVWGSQTFVDFEQSVNFCVRQVRTALNDHAAHPCYVETVPRRGYRFIAPVRTVTHEPIGVPAGPVTRMNWAALWRGAPRVAAVAGTCLLLAGGSYSYRKATHDWLSTAPSVSVRQRVELGRFFVDKFEASAALKAVEYFQLALREDPTYAPAYAGLADAYNQLASVFIAGKRPADRAAAIDAATRAIQLDPGSAEGYAALGYAAMHEMQWARAGSALRRAIQLNPQYVPARQTYATYLANQRRFDEALEEARRGVELEPASVRSRQMFAWVLYFARRYDAALVELRTILEMDRSYALGYFRTGQVLLVMGRAAEAVVPLQTAVAITNRAPAPLGLLAMALGASGKDAEALAIVEELESRALSENVPSGAMLLAYMGIDDKNRAVDMVARGYLERDNYDINIASDPLMDPLRDQPRFLALCNEVMQGSELFASHFAPRDAVDARDRSIPAAMRK